MRKEMIDIDGFHMKYYQYLIKWMTPMTLMVIIACIILFLTIKGR